MYPRHDAMKDSFYDIPGPGARQPIVTTIHTPPRRWDLFKPVWESSSATLSQTPLSVPEALPLSVTNVSRASRPVFMSPREVRDERTRYASGIFVAYHHQVWGIAYQAGSFWSLIILPGWRLGGGRWGRKREEVRKCGVSHKAICSFDYGWSIYTKLMSRSVILSGMPYVVCVFADIILKKWSETVLILIIPQLGITTDAVLELLDIPGLILAHVGLPFSHVTQIHTAMKQKLAQEKGLALEQATPLKVLMI